MNCGPTCEAASTGCWLRPRDAHAMLQVAKARHPGGSPVRRPLPKSPIARLRPGPLHIHHVLREVQPGGLGAQHAGGEASVRRRQGRPRARAHLVQGLVPGWGGPRTCLPLPGLPVWGWPLLLCSRAAGAQSRSLEGRPGWGRRPLGQLLVACPAAVAGGLPCVIGPALPVSVGPAALSVVLGAPLLLGRGLLVLLVKGGPVLVHRGLQGLPMLLAAPVILCCLCLCLASQTATPSLTPQCWQCLRMLRPPLPRLLRPSSRALLRPSSRALLRRGVPVEVPCRRPLLLQGAPLAAQVAAGLPLQQVVLDLPLKQGGLLHILAHPLPQAAGPLASKDAPTAILCILAFQLGCRLYGDLQGADVQRQSCKSPLSS